MKPYGINSVIEYPDVGDIQAHAHSKRPHLQDERVGPSFILTALYPL
jgi:hypothetical protein